VTKKSRYTEREEKRERGKKHAADPGGQPWPGDGKRKGGRV